MPLRGFQWILYGAHLLFYLNSATQVYIFLFEIISSERILIRHSQLTHGILESRRWGLNPRSADYESAALPG